MEDEDTEPTDLELLLVRSIEWTTFMDSTYDTALEQANVILRYFLGAFVCRNYQKRCSLSLTASGKIHVAKVLLGMLPRELASMQDPEERATEYLHYRQFFIAWDALMRVAECRTLENPQMAKDTRLAWLEDYKVDEIVREILMVLIRFFCFIELDK